MPVMEDTIHKAVYGFALMGNLEKGSVEEGEEFILAGDMNHFGAGRRMVSVMNMSGDLLGYVTTGQAELIRREDC